MITHNECCGCKKSLASVQCRGQKTVGAAEPVSVLYVGDRSVEAFLVDALVTMTNTGSHKGCPYEGDTSVRMRLGFSTMIWRWASSVTPREAR